ncbi:MAG: formate/nitrite transporter family protein [Candidatus Gastranaerophilales bacterium]|nr:formate/nitrite transporter family protein [Candidatus Gastranaerophilales bacterium]
MTETDNNVTQAIEGYIEKVKVREDNSLRNILLSSFFAGFMIALGAFGSVNVSAELPLGLAKLISGMVFSSGLIMIILCGTELFTGNVLTSFHFFQNGFKVKSFMKLWVLVYFGNLLGCLAVVFLLDNSGLFNAFQDKLNSIAAVKTSLSFTAAFARGIFCNILVCLAVIIANEAKTVQGKIFGIMVPITLFIASGYEHSIANMFFLPAGNVTLSAFLHNIVPVTLGNIFGAFLMAYLLFLTSKIRKDA